MNETKISSVVLLILGFIALAWFFFLLNISINNYNVRFDNTEQYMTFVSFLAMAIFAVAGKPTFSLPKEGAINSLRYVVVLGFIASFLALLFSYGTWFSSGIN